MCIQGECKKAVGQWVQFRTPWGAHRGIVQSVNQQAVLVRMPRHYAPSNLANARMTPQSEQERLDVAWAQWGYGYGGGPGYGGAPGYGGGPGYAYGGAPGYGAGAGYGRPGYGWWAGGWWWWWLAFAWIFAFAFFW